VFIPTNHGCGANGRILEMRGDRALVMCAACEHEAEYAVEEFLPARDLPSGSYQTKV